jgi:hypothetical protein
MIKAMTMPSSRASCCMGSRVRPVPDELAREEREGEGLMLSL